MNEAFYKPGGPVFLMIGGEGPASPAWMEFGAWLTYAEKLGAFCLMLEHRFYGKSHPTPYVWSFWEVVASVALWQSSDISDNVEEMADYLQEVKLSLICG